MQGPLAPEAPLRTGKWFKEEEDFTAHLIDEFKVRRNSRVTQWAQSSTAESERGLLLL